MRGWRAAVMACSIAIASPAMAQEIGGWSSLPVPGGRATLRALGVDDARERAAVMIELIRRLHFSTTEPIALKAALMKIPSAGESTLTLPLPLPASLWEKAIFGRTIPPGRLFAEILNDPSARLLFHGLAGLDASTRRWMQRQPDLLRALYRQAEAVKSFAMFAPAIQIADGAVQIPGGDRGRERWSTLLGAPPSEPAKFVDRLFLHRDGRLAGLYFLASGVDQARQRFLMGESPAAFTRLAASFAGCYPRQSNDFPFVLRSADPALLLLALNVTADGEPAGPRSQAFWEVVFADNDIPVSPVVAGRDAIDAAWLVERLCNSSAIERTAVFGTLLAGPRLFADVSKGEEASAASALQVRRLFPAIFMAMEQAGVRRPSAFVTIGRHAKALDRLNDPQSATATLQQFQGALSLALAARRAGTVDDVELDRLLSFLAAVPLRDGRYDRGLGGWIERELLPAIRGSRAPNGLTAEATVAAGLAGPAIDPPIRVRWENLDYNLDYSTSARERLSAVRARQGGDTLDHALQLVKEASRPEDSRAAEAVLGQVLAAWAYAPHLGAADGAALIGGDPSRRHDLGLREVNRTRFQQRWELALAQGDRGAVSGSLVGLSAALANWSLRRLSADMIPSPPTLGDNDRGSLLGMLSLSDPLRLTDAGMQQIAGAIAAGARIVDDARGDPERLDRAAAGASISPWRRSVLPWMLAEEPERIGDQFSIAERARLGGLQESRLSGWLTSAVPLGCLCLQAPLAGVPELIAGRPIDGIVGSRSPDLMLRVAELLVELKMPARIAPAVLAYAMRDYLDRLRPSHPSDFDAYAREARRLDRTAVEDYLGAIAAVGPLRPLSPQ